MAVRSAYAPAEATSVIPEDPGTGNRPPRERAVVPLHSLLASDSPRIHGESLEHIEMLAALEVPLPPILVHRQTMNVIDGMHRLRAARLRGEETIEVEFFTGSQEHVFALSVKLNIAHGLPLSSTDRTMAARRILQTHPQWSNRRIASNTGLSAGTVAALRSRSTAQAEQLTARVGRDGRVRPLRAAEGRLRASQVIAANPAATLRQIAGQAGIAVATAKDVRDRFRSGQPPLPPGLEAAAGELAAAPPQPVAPVGDELAVRASAAAIGLALSNMGKDPSMRTGAGRTLLLRLLSVHSIGDEAKWKSLAQSVPGHRREVLAQAARRCADHWRRFADDLEEQRW